MNNIFYTISILFFFIFRVKNPINLLLLILFIFIFIGLGFINVFIQLPTIMFIIIYLGALMMLFLFVVMLFNLQNNFLWKKNLFIYFLFVFIYFIYNAIVLTKLNFIDKATFINQWNAMDFWTIYFFNKNILNGSSIFYNLFMPEFSIFFILLTDILLCTLITAICIIFLTKTVKNRNI
jgi:NADH:ubiquinone oxidoreductase subunit 6 (subunit J)